VVSCDTTVQRFDQLGSFATSGTDGEVGEMFAIVLAGTVPTVTLRDRDKTSQDRVDESDRSFIIISLFSKICAWAASLAAAT
jgi:hypothetical protein